MNFSGAEERVVRKKQCTPSRLKHSKGIKLILLEANTNSHNHNTRSYLASRDDIQQQKVSIFGGPTTNCNNFCSFSFDELQKTQKTEILFEEQPYEFHNNGQYQQKSLPIKTLSAINLEEKQELLGRQKLVCPPTPISKLSHIDEDMHLHRIRPKGIILVSSTEKQIQKGVYQSTQISRSASHPLNFDFSM